MEQSFQAASRAQAKHSGLKKYNTGKPCLRGHLADRYTSTGQCLSCITSHSLAWHEANKEKVAISQKCWRSKRPKPEAKARPPRKTRQETHRKYSLKKRGFPNANLSIVCIPIDRSVRWSIYYDRKKVEISKGQMLYREKNREKLKQAWFDWYAENRVSQVEKAVMRRKKVMDATPLWLSIEQRKEMSGIYFESILATEKTGIKHEVDHIVPISGKLVCGLHVPWNLQVITKLENIRKSNRHTIV